MAAVTVQVLMSGTHEGKEYSFTGSEAFSNDEIASELSATLSRGVAHVSLSSSGMKQGMPEALADRMLDLECYFREGSESSICEDIKRVTGTKPRCFRNLLHETADPGILDAGGDNE